MSVASSGGPEVFGSAGITLEDIRTLAGADVFDLPEFMRVWADQFATEPGYFAHADGADLVVYPFQLRPVPDLGLDTRGREGGSARGAAGTVGRELYDLITQEYGGPIVVSADPRRAFEGFRRAFGDFCREHGIVSEFVRLTPFRPLADLYFPSGAEPPRRTVTVDLTRPEDEILRSFRKGHKALIRKLEREGVSVRPGTPDEAGAFLDVYHALMDAKQAKDLYYLSETFVRGVLTSPAFDGWMLVAEYLGEIAAASLFIGHGRVLHYYYSGTSADLRNLGASTLVVWEAARRAKAAGYEVLHLGGGATSSPDDSLLTFKKGFSSDGLVPFFMYRAVHMPEEYERLCAARAERDGLAPPASIQEGFFPWYREGAKP